MLRRLQSLKQKLDETQRKAVEFGVGPLLITAGPGSGKTTVITHRIHYLIKHLGVPPQEILVITFTKSAALEMKERFLQLTGEKNTKVVFGTFHAFFYQILRQSGGFHHDSILNEKEKYDILRNILKAQKIYFYENTFLEDLLSEISRAKNKANYTDFKSSLLEEKQFMDVFGEYKNLVSTLHKIDFDDMVIRCYELLCSHNDVLSKWKNSFRFILVDEFQDINPMQYEIVRMLAENHHNITAVGDEDQSIYSFRGSDPEIAFRFLKDYPEASHIMMTVNYRCHEKITQASKQLISHNKNRFQKEIVSFDKSEDKTERNMGIHVVYGDYEEEEYEKIALKLKEYKKAGRLQECVVLFRTNMISPLFFMMLKKHGIPYELKLKCKNFTEQPVLKDIMAYLALAKGELTRKNMFRIMNKPVRYIGRDVFPEEDFTWEEAMMRCKGKFYMQDALDQMRRDLNYISKMPIFAAIGYIAKGMRYEEWLKEQGIKTQQDGLEVLEQLKLMARECDSYEEFMQVILEQSKLNERKSDAKTAKGGVFVMTYHGAKGLEWPVVLLPEVVEGITPYRRAQSEEETEEERRMFYVAMTRAKESLYIYSVKKDERHKKSPSVFIKELEGE